MAEDKRANPYPYPTAEDVAAAPGGREIKAARNIVSRKTRGIPQRGFLLGESDHSPVVQGVLDLTTLCYKLVEQIDEMNRAGALDEEHGPLLDLNAELVGMLEDHGCPTSQGQ